MAALPPLRSTPHHDSATSRSPPHRASWALSGFFVSLFGNVTLHETELAAVSSTATPITRPEPCAQADLQSHKGEAHAGKGTQIRRILDSNGSGHHRHDTGPAGHDPVAGGYLRMGLLRRRADRHRRRAG